MPNYHINNYIYSDRSRIVLYIIIICNRYRIRIDYRCEPFESRRSSQITILLCVCFGKETLEGSCSKTPDNRGTITNAIIIVCTNSILSLLKT